MNVTILAIDLAKRVFQRRPIKGFPSELSKEFLLVDLLNNLSELVNDPDEVKEHIKEKLSSFNLDKLKEMAKWYGKVSARKFLKGAIG